MKVDGVDALELVHTGRAVNAGRHTWARVRRVGHAVVDGCGLTRGACLWIGVRGFVDVSLAVI